jgi:hypothetical protein
MQRQVLLKKRFVEAVVPAGAAGGVEVGAG